MFMTDKTKEFLQKLKDRDNWNDNYDYSKVDYINATTKVIIIDKKFNTEHLISPTELLSVRNSTKCSGGNLKDGYLSFEETKKFVSGLNIESLKYWNIYCTSGKRPHYVNTNPQRHFKSEWISWGDFLGTDRVSDNLKTYLSFNDARECVRKLNLKTWKEYKIWWDENKTNNIPKTPHNTYKNDWISTSDWLGNEVPKKRLNTQNFISNAINVHGEIYDYSKVDYVNSETKVTINCLEHGDFEQIPYSHLIGRGCPICNNGFNRKFKIKLIQNLSNSDLLTMDPVELQIIIQQGKLPSDFRPLVNTEAESDERIATLRELQERFESEEDVATEEAIDDVEQIPTVESEEITVDDIDDEITTITVEREPRLPLVNQIQDLHSLDNVIYTGMDEEAFQSLIQYKLRKIWNSLLNNDVDIDSLRAEEGGKYFTLIKEEFLNEYESVLLVEPSDGYNFRDRNGNIAQPNLMQKLTVFRLFKNKYYGNWSGTGAGKTLSFILASRNMDAKLTLVIALNSTIEQTCKSIKQVYPNSKCFTEYKEGYVFDRNEHNYLVLNYEKFQQENSERLFQSLTNNNQIDFIVIDEVHNAKQREEDNESIRRAVMTRLLGRARENENLHVLAMSATPVINNLFEAKSLLQLMSGLEYEDIQTRRTIGNALNIFQQLTLNGLRFIPKYDISISELIGRNMSNLNIDGSHLLERLLRLTSNDYIGVEKLILDDKLQAITPYLKKGVIIYSYFTTGIISKIQKYVEVLGFKVGTYTGEESTVLRTQNLKDFISGKIDIIIGSRPIGTGVDGLQDVCNRMICLTLPWTDSEYTQLKGRIYRQGSLFNEVEIIIPQVRIQLEGDDVWSWDIQRLNLIKNKKTLADAAVDGVIPSNVIPSPETLLRKSMESLKNWQDRVASGNVISTNRRLIQVDLYPEVDNDAERERRIISELSEFNRRGKTTRSETMHKEFVDNPDSWFRYHALRKSRMELWEEIPYEYIATRITDSRDVVADFGCGENLFKNCIPNNKVYSFDHVAIDETVTACDMKNTGLDDESIDVAVFSLALWGTNSQDYIKEAYRSLKRKGMIYIAEPSKDYETAEEQQKLIDMINKEGFQQVGGVENRGKFIYLTGIKI
jgi:superfamily II DNA or RNA helicase